MLGKQGSDQEIEIATNGSIDDASAYLANLLRNYSMDTQNMDIAYSAMAGSGEDAIHQEDQGHSARPSGGGGGGSIPNQYSPNVAFRWSLVEEEAASSDNPAPGTDLPLLTIHTHGVFNEDEANASMNSQLFLSIPPSPARMRTRSQSRNQSTTNSRLPSREASPSCTTLNPFARMHSALATNPSSESGTSVLVSKQASPSKKTLPKHKKPAYCEYETTKPWRIDQLFTSDAAHRINDAAYDKDDHDQEYVTGSNGIKYERPKTSYSELIREAIDGSPTKALSLQEIYDAIRDGHPCEWCVLVVRPCLVFARAGIPRQPGM